MTAPIIELTELTREFVVRRKGSGRLRERHVISAVDAMSWTVEPGESVGYIGANGAGKSTTIKMLCGILVPTSGSVRTCGLEPVKQRRDLARRIGVVFGQRSQLWWDLPLRESFTILAAIHQLDPARGDARTAELVEQLEMGETLDTPVRQLSLGQRMRAEIAAALLHSACAADPRRADDRARRAVEGTAAGVPHPRASDPRHDPAAHHPRHGRHRAALRPGAGRRPRPAGVRRHAPGPGGRRWARSGCSWST